MLNSPTSSARSIWRQRLLGALLMVLALSVTGCGLLGGGGDEDGDDEGFPEPPSRPNATVVTTTPPVV